jgi:hypothetical protein
MINKVMHTLAYVLMAVEVGAIIFLIISWRKEKEKKE